MKNPKNKGSQFEREICKKLSLWISDGQKDTLLWRSSISGGRFTSGLKKGKNYRNQVGDITAINPEGNKLTNLFSIECKFYKNLKLDSLLYQTPKEKSFYAFWEQTKKDAKLANKFPILIAKQNQHKSLICFDKVIANKFFKLLINEDLIFLTIFEKVNLIMFYFDEFIKYINFEDFEKCTKNG